MFPQSVLKLGYSIVLQIEAAGEILQELELNPSFKAAVENAERITRELLVPLSSESGMQLFPGLSGLLQTSLSMVQNLQQIHYSQADIREVRLSLEDNASALRDLLDRGDITPRITRMDLLNFIASRFSSKSYLEIGCSSDECFSKIAVGEKVGVDPVAGGTHRMTSDQFFEQNRNTFDLIFIDGLHESTQVDRDIHNALQVLTPEGIIALHDCNPLYEVRQLVPPKTGVWNGDVWRAFLRVRQDPDLDSAVGDFDYGCGVIRRRKNTALLSLDKDTQSISWIEFSRQRNSYLNLLSWNELRVWI